MRHRVTWRVACWAGALAALLVPACALAQSPQSSNPDSPITSAPAAPGDQLSNPLDMDLEQLSQADVQVSAPSLSEVVTTVSRQESTVGKSPAAVFVITQEMIRRSGATSIPEVLRMAPGVEVAKVNSSTWAISIRGFNGVYASKLLVQIDGRTLYRQTFNGVLWDVQDVVLQDVERIEVIRGPGATVWGANAVNGVINVITKSAQETQGLLVYGGTGTEEQGFSTVRYGGRIGEDFHWRAYGKQFERDGGYNVAGEFDDWRQARVGYRTDWTPGVDDHITVQGDYYTGETGDWVTMPQASFPFVNSLQYDVYNQGQNHLIRWTRILDDASDWSIQAYYDEIERVSPTIFDMQRTADVDFQYRFPLGDYHNVIVGAGYRHVHDQLTGNNPLFLTWSPESLSTDLYSAFIQDEMTLVDDLWYLTAGSKFQHNHFSDFEMQPSVRLLFTPTDRQSFWTAVSRAVRTPSRVDHDVNFTVNAVPLTPTFAQIRGNDAVVSEELYAYEMGYRAQPVDDFSFDLAMFYNNYENLIGTRPSGLPIFDPTIPGVIVPMSMDNTHSADGYGGELSSTATMTDYWELTGSYSLLYLDVHAGPTEIAEGVSAHNRMYLRSGWDLTEQWEFDLIGRYVDNLPVIGVSSYVAMDARAAWQPTPNFEWAVVGRNLLDDRHLEFYDAFGYFRSSEVQAEVFTTLTLTY